MENLKLSPPWYTLYHKVTALFGMDPEVDVIFDDEEYIIRIIVTDEKKAEAIDKLILHEIAFGNVTVKIVVKYKERNEEGLLDIYRKAFKDNPAVESIIEVPNPILGKVGYLLFKKEVVQFWNDNISNPNGIESVLYADIAGEVMKDQAEVRFTTSSENSYWVQ